MSGTSEGARKRLETIKQKYGENQQSEWAKQASKSSPGGFASDKVGKDGLTGKERARKAGQKGGALSPSNFKNDPERARRLSQEYRDKKGISHEDS
jgi:general stress protein YciG